MILSPATSDELTEYLRSRAVTPLAIRGSKPRGSAGDEIVMSKLDRILLYEPDEMIVQCQAGLPLRTLQATLSQSRQWIPTLNADEDDSTTVGGALSLDVYHPRARSTTTLRTTVLGGTFAKTNGDVFRSGSRVVKSVAGYDIHRSFVGAHGTFGVILETTLRVLPLPERFLRFTVGVESLQTIEPWRPNVLEQDGEQLLVEYSGYEEDVARAEHSLGELMLAVLSDDEWFGAIRKLRRERERLSQTSTETHRLLRDLRRVFDPEGVLE